MSAQGVDLTKLLADAGHGRELITRADIAEFAAAASAMSASGFATRTMHMPNIPKMSRRKSDSGIDVFDVRLTPGEAAEALAAQERLALASVKHTTASAAGNLRLNIAKSISTDHELNRVYLATQLRVLSGWMQREGIAEADATRTFLFMLDFPDPAHVALLGVAVIDPTQREDMIAELQNLPTVAGGGHTFRIVTFPGLAEVHIRCP